MSGPSISGEIKIDTSTAQGAVDSIVGSLEKLSKVIDSLSAITGKVSAAVEKQTKSLNNQDKAIKTNTQSTRAAASAAKAMGDLEERNANRIARATSRLQTFEQILKKKTQSGQEQNNVLRQSQSLLESYSRAVQSAQGNSTKLDTANTSLKVGVEDLNRQMNAMIKSTTNTSDANSGLIKRVGDTELKFAKLTDRIKGSALADNEKASATDRARQAMQEYNNVLKKSSSTSADVAKAQNKFRSEMQAVESRIKTANRVFRGQELESFNTKFRNLTSSVQLAMGPLSGVAARMTAFLGIMNRNAVSVALLLGSITALGVALSKALEHGKEAELQMIQLDAIIGSLGGNTTLTAERVMEMGAAIADATLTSANEARKAAGIIVQDAVMTEDQLKQTIITAQGLSQAFGGDLTQNARLLARAMNDPSQAASALRRKNITLEQSVIDTAKALRMQGDVAGANQAILGALARYHDVATNSAKTYAGALDAVSDTTRRLYERLINTSGIIDEANKQTQQFAKTINEFIDSDKAEGLAIIFEKFIRAVGTAANFALRNLDTILVVLTLIVGSVIPAAILVLGKLARSILIATKLLETKRGVLIATALATRTATGEFTKLGIAMKFALGPVGAIITGLGFAAAALYALNSAQKEGAASMNNYRNSVERTVAGVKGLTASTREQLLAQGRMIRERRGAADELVKQIYSEIVAEEAKQKTLERQLKAGRLNTSYQKERQDALLKSKLRQSELTRELHIHSEELAAADTLYKQFIKTTGELTEEQAKAMGSYRDFMGVVEKVKPDYLKIEELENQIEAFITNFDRLKQSADLELTIRDHELYEATLAAMRAQLESVQSGGKGAAKAIKEFEDAIRSITDRIKDSQHNLLTLQDQLNKTFTADPLYEFNKEFRSIKEAVSKVAETGGLNKLVESITGLGVEMDTSGVSVDTVTQALYNHLLAQQLATKGVEEMLAAQQRLDNHFKSNMGTLDTLTEKYGELMLDAAMHGDTDREQVLREQFNGEIALAQQHAQQLTRIGVNAQMSEMEQLRLQHAAQLEEIKRHHGYKKELYEEDAKALNGSMQHAVMFQQISSGATQMSKIVGGAMDAMSAAGKENSKDFQRLAIAQALINASLAILSVYKDESLTTTAAKMAMAGLIGMQAGAQVAAIKSQKFSTGGYVSGKGGPTSDSIPAWLSNGEFVMNASAVRKLGIANLNAMNQGQTPRFSTGGSVGRIQSFTKPSGGVSPNVNIHIIDQSRGVDVETTTETDANGQLQIRAIIKEQVKENLRRGEFDSDFSARFGLQRRGSMR